MIRYFPHPPEDAREISQGFLRVQGAVNAVIAKEILKMSSGEYVTREIISRAVLARMTNPRLEEDYDFDNIFYTLGDAEDDADFGQYIVPVTIYVMRRN